MSAKRNLELVHRMYDALNRQDIDAHDEFWHRDMIWHGPSGFDAIHGLDGFKNLVLRPFYAAFPDYHAKNDIEMADDNWVSATGYVTAHQRGEWMGLPPTGKFMRMRFSDFWSVENGKLKENWVLIDHVDVMKQLGVDLLAKK
jgi:predicted ester cyclase